MTKQHALVKFNTKECAFGKLKPSNRPTNAREVAFRAEVATLDGVTLITPFANIGVALVEAAPEIIQQLLTYSNVTHVQLTSLDE